MSERLTDFAPDDSLHDNEIEFFSLNVPRPGGQHVGMHIAPIVVVHRATGISVTVSDVERSQFATKEKGTARLAAVLAELKSLRAARLTMTDGERETLDWMRDLFTERSSRRYHELSERALAIVERLLADGRAR